MITFYNNTFGKEHLDVSLDSILKAIQNGRWSQQVEQYRSMPDKNATEAKEYKRTQFPAITVSGTFENERKAAKLGTHSGFIAMDFDSFPEGEDIDTARSQLYADPYTYAGFLSVSGQGLCIIVKIDPKRHYDAFVGLDRYYFAKYGYQIDQSCKDVSRLRFVSFDPDLYMNLNSTTFDQYLPKQKGRKPVASDKIQPSTSDDIEFILSQIEDQKIDITAPYEDWIAIGMSIKSAHGDSPGLDYYQRVSQFHPEYDYDNTERKFRSFKPNQKGIGLFMSIAKRNGLQITTPKTKHITTVALYAKKTRRSAQDAVEQLQTVDGIPSIDSEPIVRQIFENKDSDLAVSVDDNEELLHQLQEHLRRNEQIRFNEITLKYELNNQPMTDRDMNTVYLNAKSVLSKVSKELVMACIDSDRTKTVNPVKDFFLFNSGKAETGESLIDRLADTINTGKDNKDFVRYFVRKWMIGAVAMWHKHHSPLMLILAGTRQNTGKSHWFRYLLPQELQPYYAEAELTGDKDENLLMCSKLLVMNDEMSNKSKRDITIVKKLCSAKWFNLRRPYGRFSEDFRRLAALAGTSNDLALLNDPTGNRRLIPIEVYSIDHAGYNSINKIQLWVEAYRAYKSGESFELTHTDIDQLAKQTEDFEEPSVEAETITAYFEPGQQQQLTNTQIKSYIEVRTKQRLSAKKLGQELRRLGFETTKRRVNNVPMQVYSVREVSGVIVQTFLQDAAPF
jgi:predicted P-loop ATPase